jgi:hypothetical protein
MSLDLTVPVGEALLVRLVPEEEVDSCRSLLQGRTTAAISTIPGRKLLWLGSEAGVVVGVGPPTRHRTKRRPGSVHLHEPQTQPAAGQSCGSKVGMKARARSVARDDPPRPCQRLSCSSKKVLRSLSSPALDSVRRNRLVIPGCVPLKPANLLAEVELRSAR